VNLLRRPRRNLLTVREWAQREDVAPATARKWIRAGLVRARDLNAGSGKRPRWRILASQRRPQGRG